MEKVRFGIIGAGNQGSHYACSLFNKNMVENGRLTAVCDNDEKKIENIKSRLNDKNVSYFYDYKEMLGSELIDAVIVAVPHYFHPEMTIHALNAGINVICEKPAGVYTKQVKEMNDTAEKSDKLFTMMFNQRTNCVYRKMRELIKSGAIGEVTRVNWIITNWFRSQSYYDSSSWRATWKGEGGGVLLNQCPHQLDLLQWILGMMPQSIRSFCHFGKWHDIEVEDDVTAYLEYENGATGVFVTSTADCPGTNRLEIMGNCGKLICEDEKLKLYHLKEGVKEFNERYKGGFGEPEKEEIEVETDGVNLQHLGVINNFANAVLGIEPLHVDGKEGILGVEIMDAILLSTWLDKKVTLPIDDDLYLAELNKRIKTGRVKAETAKILDTDGTFGSKK